MNCHLFPLPTGPNSCFPVADPGFPVGRAPTSNADVFGKNICENERIVSCWVVCASGAPGSATVLVYVFAEECLRRTLMPYPPTSWRLPNGRSGSATGSPGRQSPVARQSSINRPKVRTLGPRVQHWLRTTPALSTASTSGVTPRLGEFPVETSVVQLFLAWKLL